VIKGMSFDAADGFCALCLAADDSVLSRAIPSESPVEDSSCDKSGPASLWFLLECSM
jgi:hypothetical protein